MTTSLLVVVGLGGRRSAVGGRRSAGARLWVAEVDVYHGPSCTPQRRRGRCRPAPPWPHCARRRARAPLGGCPRFGGDGWHSSRELGGWRSADRSSAGSSRRLIMHRHLADAVELDAEFCVLLLERRRPAAETRESVRQSLDHERLPAAGSANCVSSDASGSAGSVTATACGRMQASLDPSAGAVH